MRQRKTIKVKAIISIVLAITIVLLQATNYCVLAASTETENPVEESVEESTELSTEITVTETPIDTSTEVPTTESSEESTENTTEESTESSTEVSTETSTEESTETSTENTTEASTEESTEISTEISTETSTEVSTELTTETSTEESTELSTETESIESLKEVEDTGLQELSLVEETSLPEEDLVPKGNYDTNFTSKWSTPLTRLASTSTGIVSVFEEINGIDTIVYTIPSDFEGTKINLNVVEDARKLVGASYVPGDLKSFTIKVVNNSNYEFSYVPSSFVITTEDLSTRYSNFIANAIGFDGSPIAYDYAGYRTSNIALKELFGSNISADMLTDENLGNKLVEAGYSNGIADLDKFYLDYYNNFMGTSVGRLEDFSDDVIKMILTGSNSGIKETNKQVAELGYNWFYNRMLSVIPSGVSEDSSYNYTVGEYMRNRSLYENYCQSAFNTLVSKSDSTLNPIKLYSNAKSSIDAFVGISFGYLIGMQLEREVPDLGSLEISKVDEKGNLITSSPAEFIVYYLDENQQPMYYTISGSFSSNLDDSSKLATTNGKLTINNLPLGKYYIKEVTAPAGYIIDNNTYDLTIKANQVTSISIINTEEPTPTGSLTIVKVDSKGNKITTSSAKFKLFKLDATTGKHLYYNGTDFTSSEDKALVLSTKDGSVTINGLEVGNYFITETKAPDGYILDSSEIQTLISADATTTVKVVNKKTPMGEIIPEEGTPKPTPTISTLVQAVTPKTGDNSVSKIIFYVTLLLLGILLILLSSLERDYQKVKSMGLL